MSLQHAKALQLLEEEAQAKMLQEEVELEPPERVRRHLFNLVIECSPLSSDEMSFILTQLETVEAR
jgi:hypothetical protein